MYKLISSERQPIISAFCKRNCLRKKQFIMTENCQVIKHQISAVLLFSAGCRRNGFLKKKKMLLEGLGYWEKKIPSGGRRPYVKKNITCQHLFDRKNNTEQCLLCEREVSEKGPTILERIIGLLSLTHPSASFSHQYSS